MKRRAPALMAISVGVLLALAGREAKAHLTNAGYVEIVATSSTNATITFARGALRSDARMVFDGGCSLLPTVAPVMQLHCPGGLSGNTLEVVGLREQGEAIVLRLSGDVWNASTTVLTSLAPRFAIPGESARRGVLSRYALVGFRHVLEGADHLLMMLALMIDAETIMYNASFARRMAALSKTATLFTLAHSGSLVATALGWLAVPSRVAETAIAASLVVVANDLARSPRRPIRGGAVVGFGLAHGLGFASGLTEVGLPHGSTALALFAFNVGVEVAQCFAFAAYATLVAAACALLALARVRWRIRSDHSVASDRSFTFATVVASYGVGVAGAAMFISRTRSLLFQ